MSQLETRLLSVLCIAIGLAASTWPARAVDIQGVQPGALDQPRINALIRLTPNGDPLTFEGVYNFEAYYDTGASGILLSDNTATLLNVPRSQYPAGSGHPVVFEDVGVAGPDRFHVSQPLYLGLAPYDYAVSNVSQYTRQFGPVRTEIGPVDVIDPNPLLADLDIIGAPAMAGKVVVMDPKPVNTFWDTIHTYVYEPGTPANPASPELGPGIPATSRHVNLTFASFDRFTRTTPSGATGPTLAGNPFIGPNPLSAIDPTIPPGTNPGIKASCNGQTVTGSWLLDTGAAASIISTTAAEALGVTYQPGTKGTDNPVLLGTPLENQFTLTVGGIGGTTRLAGFFLDSLLLRTQEGVTANDNDPNHIRFLSAPVLVGDISLADPVSGKTLTLDGIFGMNYLVASAFITEGEEMPVLDNLTPGAFDWIVFDQAAGKLGLQVATGQIITGGAQYWYGSLTGGTSYWSPTDDCFYTMTEGLYKDGDQVVFGDTIDSIFGSLPVASHVVNIRSPVAPGSILVDTAQTYTFQGAAIRGYTGLTKRGSGVLRLANSNTYSGPTDIIQGTIELAAPQDIGPVYVGSGASLVMETSQRLEALNILGGTARFTPGAGKTLKVKDVLIQDGGALDLKDAAVELESDLRVTLVGAADRLTISTSIRETPGAHASLTKSGNGTLVLGGANSYYTGATTVNNGTLKLAAASANNIASSPTISVNSGATLDVGGLSGGRVTLASGQTLAGTGTVAGGVVAANGSHVAPGIGTLAVGTLTMAAGSVYDYQFNSTPANGLINVNTAGGLTVNGGGFNLYKQGSTTPFATPGTYKLLQYSGGIGGVGTSALSVANPLPGMTYGFSASTSDVDLNIQPAVPPQQPRPTPPTLPPAATKNLIVYTHGWNTSEADWTNPNGPWVQLSQAFNAAVAKTGAPSDWSVMGWDWTASDGNLLTGPGPALNNAQLQGLMTGKLIADGHYSYVHFIAHSAGSALISEAAFVVAALSPGTVIQTTYLSPYAPSAHYQNMYGAYGSQGWSDNYIDTSSLPGTMPTLVNSHNVDVTPLDPNPTNAASAHGWPLDYYIATITSPTPQAPFGYPYGFPRSLEGGGWDTRSSYPLGNTPVILGGSGTTTPGTTGRQDAPLDFSKNTCFASTTGAVAIAGSGFSLATGSPVWMSSLLTVAQPVNELSFDANFVNNGAEGLLAVYWNDQCLGEIDQRYVLDGSQEYSFFLPQTFEPGTYSLAFRLDPYTATQSTVAIDNVSTGFAAVPEPCTLALLLAASFGLVGVVFHRRRRAAGH